MGDAKLPSTVTFSGLGVDTYKIKASSNSGNNFYIEKLSSGATQRTCDTSGKGACPSSGSW
jgi:hypothetical protein